MRSTTTLPLQLSRQQPRSAIRARRQQIPQQLTTTLITTITTGPMPLPGLIRGTQERHPQQRHIYASRRNYNSSLSCDNMLNCSSSNSNTKACCNG